jgi:ribosomal protein S1
LWLQDVNEAFQVGQTVRARVLKVDPASCRLSLGLKPSYFEGQQPLEATGEREGGAVPDFDEVCTRPC